MITRAHIRRQLRASGGITSLTPREGYFLGSIVRGAKKAIGKVADVAKQVVKSPIGKAALIGGLATLPFGGPAAAFRSIGGGLSGLKAGLLGTAAVGGPPNLARAATKGLLGSGGKMSLLTKLTGGAGLLTYFMSKGATEEEAEELAKDVYRGEGIGFDQIRADLNKYRSGALSQSQMFDKNYRFLTPRNFVAKDGGSPNMQMAEIPKGLTMEDAVKTFKLSNGRDPKNMQEVIDFFKNRKLSAQGGRIGYDEGSNSIDFKVEKELKDKAPGSYKLFGGGALSPLQHMLRYLTKKRMEKEEKKKNKKADGGIMNMPMGNMRRNRAGVMERDYRDKGGFVPVGVKEKADDVPAMLSKNEFVMTADAVRGAGDGNIKKGAQRMYDLMKRNEGKVA